MIIQIALANWPVVVLPKACVRSTRYETDFGARYDAALALGDIFSLSLAFPGDNAQARHKSGIYLMFSLARRFYERF